MRRKSEHLDTDCFAYLQNLAENNKFPSSSRIIEHQIEVPDKCIYIHTHTHTSQLEVINFKRKHEF